ncbi:MAG: helix-turn-helix domain-containing protein [Prosthecobacter sp.]
MPFCYFTIRVAHGALKAFMLRKKGMVEQPGTLGEHLRNRRLTLGLRQETVASQLGALREVYDRWERDERQPVVSEWPGILSFLGCYPFAQNTAADRVLKARRCQGMDQKQMAQAVGVIHQTLRRWEHGFEFPDEGNILHLERLARLPEAMPLTGSPTSVTPSGRGGHSPRHSVD